MKSLKDMKPGNFRVVGEANAFDWEHKKVARVPFCRIMPEYKDAFKHEEYEVVKAPKQLYELFQQEASR